MCCWLDIDSFMHRVFYVPGLLGARDKIFFFLIFSQKTYCFQKKNIFFKKKIFFSFQITDFFSKKKSFFNFFF